MRIRIYITIALIVIWLIFHLFFSYLNFLFVLDILLLNFIAVIFPFFAFKSSSPYTIPTVFFFLINTSLMGKAISKLNILFDQKNNVEAWVIKILLGLIYLILLMVNYNHTSKKIFPSRSLIR